VCYLSTCLYVTLCIGAKRYILLHKCLNKWIWSAYIGTRFYNLEHPAPTLSPQTPHLWNCWHLANKWTIYCEQLHHGNFYVWNGRCQHAIGSFSATAAFPVLSYFLSIVLNFVCSVLCTLHDLHCNNNRLTQGEDFNFAEIHRVVVQRKLHNDVLET